MTCHKCHRNKCRCSKKERLKKVTVPVKSEDACDIIDDETKVAIRETLLGLVKDITNDQDPCGSESNPCPESLEDCGCNGRHIGIFRVTPLIGTSVYEAEVDDCLITKGTYKVYNALGGVVRHGQFTPDNHIFYLNLSNLNADDYSLEVSGINCAGKSVPFKFAITNPLFGPSTGIPTPTTSSSQPIGSSSQPGASFDVLEVEVLCLI